jgi:S1-C subfamily serine protease
MPEGLGFAIPINLVRGVMEQLIAHGRVIRGYLGVDESSELPADQSQILGIEGPAVLITRVSGPAEAAGIRPGDVLTHINGQRIFAPQDAMIATGGAQPGERVSIRGVRPNGMVFETEAVLQERPRRP